MSDITSCLYHVTEFVMSLEEESAEQSSVVVDLVTDVLVSAQRKSQHTTDTEKAVTNQGTELLCRIRNKSLRVDMFMYICTKDNTYGNSSWFDVNFGILVKETF